MADSPLAYKFVAAPDRWNRNGDPIRGITVHMAEGGGTVSWLTRNDGNSSHYVVEYDGRIVQMVLESLAAGSINPREIRATDDAPYAFLGETIRYGVTAAKKVMGAGWASPNTGVIAIEVEGYAATGPNLAQRRGIAALIADIRRRQGPLGVLGHRDWQNYKACPGKRIPWLDYGGHTAKAVIAAPIPQPEAPKMAIKGDLTPEVPTRVHLKLDPNDPTHTKSAWLYVWSDHRADAGNKQLQPLRPLLLTRLIDADTYAVAYEPTTADTNDTSLEMFVKVTDILKTEVIPDVTPFAQADLDKTANAAIDAVVAAANALRPKAA